MYTLVNVWSPAGREEIQEHGTINTYVTRSPTNFIRSASFSLRFQDIFPLHLVDICYTRFHVGSISVFYVLNLNNFTCELLKEHVKNVNLISKN